MIVRPGLKSLPGTNALAYYKNLKIMDEKSFITLRPDVELHCLIHFLFVNCNKSRLSLGPKMFNDAALHNFPDLSADSYKDFLNGLACSCPKH
jgi:hypothetical protein